MSDESNKPIAAAGQGKHVAGTIGLIVISVVFLAILAKALFLNPHKAPPSPLVGKAAEEFRVEWLQGQEFLPAAAEKTFRLSDFKGKPLILNFWASWCVSCRQEAHELQLFWEAHQGEGVAVAGIAIQDTSAAALRFARYYGKTYILGLDGDGRTAIDYGVTGVPETFFIDANGVIKHKETGPVSGPMLEKLLPTITD